MIIDFINRSINYNRDREQIRIVIIVVNHLVVRFYLSNTSNEIYFVCEYKWIKMFQRKVIHDERIESIESKCKTSNVKLLRKRIRTFWRKSKKTRRFDVQTRMFRQISLENKELLCKYSCICWMKLSSWQKKMKCWRTNRETFSNKDKENASIWLANAYVFVKYFEL